MPDQQDHNTRAGRAANTERKRIRMGKSWFLGIGINAYPHFPPLRNACKDVEDVLQLLRAEYDVDEAFTLFDAAAGGAAIIDQLQHLSERISPDDKLIIYYSGHGYLDQRGRGYWLPYDAERDRVATFLRNSTIREFIEDIPARHTLLISDSCFSGALLTRGVDAYADAALEELERDRSRWVLSSGRQSEEVADGEPGFNSPFTAGILRVLRENREARLNVGLLYDRVLKITRYNYEQQPQGAPLFKAGHEGGQYIFHRKAAKPRRPAKQSTAQPAVAKTAEITEEAKVKQHPSSGPPADSFTDPRDGRTYRTVWLGGQLWMAENLAYDTGEGCWFYDDDPKNGEQYGRLYTWEAARRACPPGWRLPTDEEWHSLSAPFGGAASRKEALKEVGKATHAALAAGGSSGFSARPGGARLKDGSFSSFGDTGFYWTATEYKKDQAWVYYFYRNKGNRHGKLSYDRYPKTWGMSCRCVREV